MKIYLITDTHFHHDELIDLCGRPKNHTGLILDNWKKAVTEDDLTIHLGDVTWHTPSLKENLDYVPGRKILIMGNHDEKPAEWYMKNGFDFACEELFLTYRGTKLHFTHDPVKPVFGTVNVCGHLHNNDHRAHGYDIGPFHRLLCLEEPMPSVHTEARILAYKPIRLDHILR